MKKLEDIPKKNILEVPDGYFDKLPGIIQSRISTEKAAVKATYIPALRWAIPAMILIVMASIWFSHTSANSPSPEELLANVDTEDLIAYLEETDITTEELIESADLTTLDVDLIQTEVNNMVLDVDSVEEWLIENDVEFENLQQ